MSNIADNAQTVDFRCRITHMFKGCPKPDGWFGCFAKRFNSDSGSNDIRLTGVTQTAIPTNATLDVTAVEKPDGSYELIHFEIVTKTITGTISYLSSFSGVSRAVAKKIVDKFGIDSISVIKSDPKKLKTEVGLSKKQADAVMAGVNANNLYNKIRAEFPELSQIMVQRVAAHVNDIQSIRDDPYSLLNITGISFPIADAIALRIGHAPFSAYRVNHGLVYTLETRQTGDMYVDMKNDQQMIRLMNELEARLKIQFTSENELRERIRIFAGIRNSPITIDTDNNSEKLYLTMNYLQMMTLVNNIRHNNHTNNAFGNSCINNLITDYELHHNMNLTPEQRNAVTNALKNTISIITGGPGRGKTSIIDCLASCWINNFKSSALDPTDHVLLLAPTGKAMNKLSSATKNAYRTMTIDKLIVMANHISDKKSSAFGWLKPMRSNGSTVLIIVDESSMIDIAKAAELISNFPTCNYCFVGDVDQLPPIAPGHFLKDLIDSKKIATSYLTVPLRNGGNILANADKINNHDANLNWDFKQMPFYPQQADDQTALDAIIEQYNDERQDCPDITQLALLCPMKKGMIGVANLNMTIQEIVCPEVITAQPTYDSRRNELVYIQRGYPIPNTIYGTESKYTKFRIGDIVMNTKNMNQTETYCYSNNDYWNGDPTERSMGVFNGDCGKIIGYVPSNRESHHAYIIVQFFDNRIAQIDQTEGEFESFDLGYALTVHKSQGCEYKTVIFVSPCRLEQLVDIGFGSKNLVYTAVTRAKERVVVLGSKESLTACIKADLPPRNSDLAAKLQ